MKEFDLIVIGGGPAGYTGAIRAAQMNMNVACIEKNNTLGGTCLNIGCIPSKALLNASEKFDEAKTSFKNIGIEVEPKLNLGMMMNKKSQVVADLCKGIEGLFNKNKITKFSGNGRFIDSNTIEIIDGDDRKQIRAKNILIASGSKATEIQNIQIDEKFVVSSTGALSLTEVPKSLVVIGGGYIGLELGSVWRRLGSKVTIIEYANQIVPAMDQEVSDQFLKILKKQGLNFMLNTKVVTTIIKNNQVITEVQNNDNSEQESVISDVVLVAVGRKPYTAELGLDAISISLDEYGRIPVNGKFQTSVPNVYAVGDVIPGPMLAHKAEEEAIAAIENMNGQAGHINYNIIPSVIYTHPEVASVGATEEELKKNGVSYKVGKFPFLANSRARTIDSKEGMVKILADSNTDRVLGAHIIGPDAGTLIAEVAMAMEFSASSEDIARTCHAHPTLSEAIKEAALAVDKRAINF
ncbi:MAG: dihydrolipoyl dehydrogenase [Rickettsiaceae bacterium]|nr:MAG: dihydrolipoyl dehydrogenase [Rickettsiaceae bacterium]